jgi:hypothetical protein
MYYDVGETNGQKFVRGYINYIRSHFIDSCGILVHTMVLVWNMIIVGKNLNVPKLVFKFLSSRIKRVKECVGLF